MSSAVIPTGFLNSTALLARVKDMRYASPAISLEPTDLKERYDHYVQLFGNASIVGTNETIQKNLKNQLNVVLSLIPFGKAYDFPLDVAKILDENKLPESNVCKSGNIAYKFYVQKIVSELNNFHEILANAKDNLEKLRTLIEQKDFGAQAVNELLTRLSISEAEAKNIIQKFSEYRIPKNLDIKCFDFYIYNGQEKMTPTAHFAKSGASGSERYTQPESAFINLTDNMFPSPVSAFQSQY